MGEDVFIDVFVDLVLNNLLTNSSQRVSHEYAQAVLMTVQCEYSHLRGVAGGQDAGYISVCIEWQLHLACLVALDVVAQQLDACILLAGLRVFIGVETWILQVLVMLGEGSAEHRHGVFLHLAFVVAYPDNLFRISREHHSRVKREFLLVHPVRQTIDYLIALTVFRHLTLGIVVEQLHQVDVVVADESHL